MSERMMTQQQDYEYPVLEEWRAPIHPYDNIRAEIHAAMHLFQRVEYDEGAHMSGESLSRQAAGITILWELHRAMQS